MTAYILNENISDEELSSIKNAAEVSGIQVDRWPDESSSLPADIEAAILIIREKNTSLEESRALAAVSASVRIVCVFLEDVSPVSELSQKYCSAKVAIGAGTLGDALAGNDSIQEKPDGTPADKNPQKPHNC